MSALLEIYLKKETIQTILKVLEAKQQNGFSVTLSVNDETNAYGQNVTAYASQSKDERESKKEKFYVGNGKVFYVKDGIKVAVKQESEGLKTEAQKKFDEHSDISDSNSLPF